MCTQVQGAKPAANITWYNNTTPLKMDNDTDRTLITEKSVSCSSILDKIIDQIKF